MSEEKVATRSAVLRCLASLCLTLVLVSATLAGPGAAGAVSSPPSLASSSAALLPEPISGVILADESGTETAASIHAERAAAAALVESDPSTASQFMIAGFGSQNQLGQRAVAPYCDFIRTASPAARNSLAACASQIHARTQAQGWDTDQAQALEFAIQQLRVRPGLKVIFLLTDGNLDVSNSPIYGRVPSQRTPEAMRILEQQILPAARAGGIQVWPLGFGPDASYASLERFAVGAGAVDGRCASTPASQPRAITVSDFSELVYKLVSDQTAARCGSVGAPSGGDLAPGGTIALHVRIPVIASYGALAVVTGSPQVRVDFIAPNGVEVPSDGSVDGQTLHRAGVGTGVQSLRIVNPMSGLWTVKLTAPRGLVAQTRVIAFASWEGVLSASLFVSPVQAIPGQPVNIELRVLSRSGVVSGPALSSLAASAAISGKYGRVAVPLHLARNVAFRGVVTLPKGATGQVLVSARISGIGIAGDQASETIFTQSQDFLSANFSVDVPHGVHPGSVMRGQVTMINQGAPTRGVLHLQGFSPGALVTIAASPVAIPSGSSTASFTIRIAPRMKLGPAFVSVVLDRQDGQAIAAMSVDMRVVAAPSWWDRSRAWVIPLGIAVLLLTIASIARAHLLAAGRARAADTRDLTATLLVDGRPAGPSLCSDGGAAFPLMLIDDGTPHLVHGDVPCVDGIAITIRRNDQSVCVAAGEDARQCRFGEPVALSPGLALQVDSADKEVISEHGAANGDAPEASNNTSNNSVAISGRWR